METYDTDYQTKNIPYQGNTNTVLYRSKLIQRYLNAINLL